MTYWVEDGNRMYKGEFTKIAEVAKAIGYSPGKTARELDGWNQHHGWKYLNGHRIHVKR